jgi:hypothetical protein
MKKLVIYQGNTFGKLTALYEVQDGKPGQRWFCQCECGEAAIVSASNLHNGNTKPCGCERIRKIVSFNTKHGQARQGATTSEYRIWMRMIQRCFDASDAGYPSYGGRGITVCDRWRSFKNFFADMGPRPSSEYSIDRIDNNGNYELGNCRWATRTEQARNTRTNRFLTYQGETLTIAEWAERLGVDYHALFARLKKGWSTEEALSTPFRKMRRARKGAVSEIYTFSNR